MKKVLLIACSMSLFAAATNAQTTTSESKKEEKKIEKSVKKEKRTALRKLKGNEPSYQAKEQFKADFGNTPATSWKRDENYDVVTFSKGGVTQTAYYDADAKLVGTVMPKTFADLPSKAQEHINKKYADYSKGSVILYDDNEDNATDMILFDQQFAGKDSYFVELTKNSKKIILSVDMNGEVGYFRSM